MKLRSHRTTSFLATCSCSLLISIVRAGEPEIAFLRERVSVPTSYGVTGFAPGTRVKILSRHSGVITVKSEDQQFDVSPDQLITDTEAARALRARALAEQQAAQQQVEQQEAARRAAQQQDYQSPSPTDTKARLEAQIRDVQKQKEQLQTELDRVHSDQKDAGPENRVRYTKRHTAWGHIKSISTSPNAAKLALREKELRQQIEDLKEKERLLRQAASKAAAAEKERQLPTALAAAATPIATPAPTRPIAISAPRPDYPYEARAQHITGAGIVVFTIDPTSGTVTDVTIAQSMGSPILDNAAVSAFRRWRFKPGTYDRQFRMPISYTMTGASY